jgi:hypothetical protein
MTEAELKAIVEEIVRSLLGGQASIQPTAPRVTLPPGQSVLFVLTGSEFGHARSLELIRTISSSAAAQAYPAACYTERHGADALVKAMGCPKKVHATADLHAREKLVDEATACIFLLPLRSTLSKIANAIPDSPPAAMVTRALMRGIPCFVAGGDADPAMWPRTMPAPMRQGRNSFAELLDDTMNRLAAWGLAYRADPMDLVPLVTKPDPNLPAGSASPSAAPALPEKPAAAPPRTFITSEDIRKRYAEGAREIRLPSNAIITDEARETATSLTIKIT